MGSGFVLNALASTGASVYISGKNSAVYYDAVDFGDPGLPDNTLFISSTLSAVLCALSPWTSGKILSLRR